VLSSRLLALLKKMPESASAEDVHRFRTTLRRLEVHLGKCPSKIAKSLRKLRKRAGKVRDTDVHLLLLKSSLFARSLSGGRTPVDSREKLRKALGAKREHDLSSLRRLIAAAAPSLEAKLPGLAGSAERPEPGIQQAAQLTAQARGGFLQWTRNIPEESEQLHRLRISTKKLRYSLEPLEAFPLSAELAAHLRQVQDAIGNWHDWATLLQLAGRELGPSGSDPAYAALEARTGREYRKARRIAQDVRQWMIAVKPVASAEGGNSTQPIIRKAG
jgi:CHAD domain-containing protein